jgi:hypothetical protein
VSADRRYVGAWRLPSGNQADVWLTPDGLECRWNHPPSPSWPRADVEHWQRVTFPEIVRAVATVTGLRVLGVTA